MEVFLGVWGRVQPREPFAQAMAVIVIIDFEISRWSIDATAYARSRSGPDR